MSTTYTANLCPLCGRAEFASLGEDFGEPIRKAIEAAPRNQFAKQGISFVHAGLSHCPHGRRFGSQSLKNVIWQARNQAIHWEEGRLNKAVQSCFQTLAAEVGPSFGDFLSGSMAFEVVKLLDWRDFRAFEADMLLIA